VDAEARMAGRPAGVPRRAQGRLLPQALMRGTEAAARCPGSPRRRWPRSAGDGPPRSRGPTKRPRAAW
jgi:hypothetical protein